MSDAASATRTVHPAHRDVPRPGVVHPAIRAEVYRGPVLESAHQVHGVMWSPEGAERIVGGPVTGWGDTSLVTTLRSSLKPFQALILAVDGVAARYGLSDSDLAIATGSHSGEPRHVEVVSAFMEKVGVHDDDLQCGRHRPFHKDSAKAVGDAYTVRHNNCSGKHTAMVAWCKAQGVDPSGYLEAGHPVQKRILELTAHFAGLPEDAIGVATDGCGVPTFAMPLASMARMFRFLAAPQAFGATGAARALGDEERDAMVAGLARVRDAMAHHGYLVGGTERADTDVIHASEGRILMKAGAEGLWCGCDTEAGSGFAFKALDGNFRAVVPAAIEALARDGHFSAESLTKLKRHHVPEVKDLRGNVVGRIVPRLVGV